MKGGFRLFDRGWNVRRDERFAELIEKGFLTPGDILQTRDSLITKTAIVSENYGLIVDGLRYESPDLATRAVGAPDGADGWIYWSLMKNGKIVTLADLRNLSR